jgi:hypothetical protein
MTEDQWTAYHQDEASTQVQSAAAAAAQALSRLTDLARVVLQTQASLARQTVDLTWGTLVGDLDRVIANKSYAESVGREGARCWRTVGELSLHCASDLVALGRSLSSIVLREVAAAGRKATTGAPVEEADGRRAEVRLQGSVGQRAEGTIVVANQHPRPRRIQLSAGNLVDSSGVGVAADLAISPTMLTVASGQERVVRIEVDLDDASFSAGEQYSCTVFVSGGDKATIDVLVQVEGLTAVSAGQRQERPSPQIARASELVSGGAQYR